MRIPVIAVIYLWISQSSCGAGLLISLSELDPPTISAGPDQSVANSSSGLVASTQPLVPTVTWSQISGPGQANFSDPNQLATTVTVDSPGIYLLEVKAISKEGMTVSDTVEVAFNVDLAISSVDLINRAEDGLINSVELAAEGQDLVGNVVTTVPGTLSYSLQPADTECSQPDLIFSASVPQSSDLQEAGDFKVCVSLLAMNFKSVFGASGIFRVDNSPPDPTSLSATVNSDSQIILNWSSGGGSTAAYRISYQLGATEPSSCSSGSTISHISGTAHAVAGLTAGSQYSFRVCALNNNGTPDMSAGVSVTATTTSQSAPPNPLDVQATVNSGTAITISWNSGGGSTAGYRIAYQVGPTAPVDCTSATIIDESSISGTSHSVTGLSEGRDYSFRVCASNANPTPDHSSGIFLTETTRLSSYDFSQVSSGSNHSCGVRSSDGRVFCWGSGSNGQLGDGDTGDHSSPVAISSTDSFNSISAGQAHTCGIRSSDGQVFCWGSGAFGQLGDGDTGDHPSPVAINNAASFNSISVGEAHTCGIRSSDGRVFCWGRSNYGQLGDGDTDNHSSPVAINNAASFNSISAGRFQTCGIRSSDGQVFCWGRGTSGELGDGDTGNHSSPVAINNAASFTSISSAEFYSCGIRSSDGQVFCWGRGNYGQLGDGDTGDHSSPVAINNAASFADISSGGSHTCGIRSSDGQVFCWGYGSSGQLGDGDTDNHSSPVAINNAASFADISSGGSHTCGIRSSDGQVFCWGYSSSGQLGDGNTGGHSSPVAMMSADSFQTIAAGYYHTCGIRSSDGQVFCWGRGTSGELGDGDTGNHSSPVAINNAASFNSISAGEAHTCGIRSSDGQVFCWGSGSSGQLGDGDTGDHSSPVAINNVGSFNSISVGKAHTCGIRSSDGQVFCWGRGNYGQLGDGSTGDHSSPVAINNAASFTSISSGEYHTCGIRSSDGQVFCWGSGFNGQLGDGDTGNHSSPVAINNAASFTSISSGGYHTCGIRSSDGQAFCWGYGHYGQLGDGGSGDHSSPVAMISAGSFQTIAAGYYHNCGIRSSDRQVFCWGRGHYGQLGDGDTGNHSSPVAINNAASFTSISSGEFHSCGIRSSDDKVFCWGSGYYGQLGNGFTLTISPMSPLGG